MRSRSGTREAVTATGGPDGGPQAFPAPLRLSVVLATREPWPAAREALESVYSQALALDAEVLLADGHGEGLPPPHAYPELRRLRRPGATAYQLRGLLVTAAGGDIVAMTEDHCRVAEDWCERVLAAHAAHPEADVIGGAVENGADESLGDWANFLVSNGPFLLPIPVGRRPDVAGQANITYKRRALPATLPDHGLEEAEYKATLRAAGFRLFNDDRMVVAHVQRLGLWGGCRIHFHDGRAIAGFRREGARRLRRWRTFLAGLLWAPLRIPRDTARVVARTFVRKPRQRWIAVRATPLVALVLLFHVAGDLTGRLAGPGSSPWQLR